MLEPAPDPVERFVAAAREIQKAASVAEVARAMAATMGSDTAAATRGALEACLTELELSLAQRTAASLELASDLRMETRRKLARILAAHTDPELAASVADVAVQAVGALSGALTIALAATQSGDQPVAFAGLAGAMFVSASARQFAIDHGIDDAALDALLCAAAAPIRRACQARDVCNVGELRFTGRAQGIAASAHLHRSNAGAPVIRIRLHDANHPPDVIAVETGPQPYPARLLRRLVS